MTSILDDLIDAAELAWMKDAACTQDDAELFHSPIASDVRVAKLICEDCPVQRDCLEWGRDDPWGIYGGLTAPERHQPEPTTWLKRCEYCRREFWCEHGKQRFCTPKCREAAREQREQGLRGEKWTADELTRVYELSAQGYGGRKIAKEIGRSRYSIYGALKRYSSTEEEL